jgi:hypothetical protein
MTAAFDRSAPGVRVSVIRDEKALAGEPFDLRGRLLSFTYEDSERKADKVTLELDNFDLALFAREELMGGALLEVAWGYPGHMAPPRRVVVKKLKGFGTLTVEGQALSALMNRRARTRRFENRTRGEVAREIAAEYGYEGGYAAVDEAGERLDVVVQANETDARFLRRLAAKEEREFYVDDSGFHFHERRQDTAPTHVFTWYADPGRGDVLSVSVESDLGRRTGRVTVKGRDPLTKQTIEEVATSDTVARATLAETIEVVDPETGRTSVAPVEPAAPADGDIFTGEPEMSVLDARNATEAGHATPAATPTRARGEADARFRRAERASVKLSLQVVGDPTLRAKSVVEVRGISPLLSGKYYVAELRHTVNGSGYVCDLKLTRDGKGRHTRGGQPAPAQGGEHNEAQPAKGAEPVLVETIDPETGRTRIEFRGGPGRVGAGDPEGGGA